MKTHCNDGPLPAIQRSPSPLVRDIALHPVATGPAIGHASWSSAAVHYRCSSARTETGLSPGLNRAQRKSARGLAHSTTLARLPGALAAPCTRRFAWALVLVFLLFTSLTQAATWTVINNWDSGSGSLRQAISDAVAGDEIVFDAALDGQTITLTSGELSIAKDLTITGPGADLLAISGNSASRVFFISSGKTVTMTGLTVKDGSVVGGPADADLPAGAGIYNAGTLTLGNCLVRNNSVTGAYDAIGGGIYNDTTGTLTLNFCVVKDNSVSNKEVGGAGGGGIGYYGAVTLNNCTISGNSAISATNDALGGGLGSDFEPKGVQPGALTLNNCTVSGNSVSGRSNGTGGGIDIENKDSSVILTVTLNNCTISGNSATSNGGSALGGGIYPGSVVTLNLKNTIVAGNTTGTAGNPPDIAGVIFSDVVLTLNSDGHNLVGVVIPGDITLAAGDLSGTLASPLDPLLGPLQDNGGPTFTHALLEGSPALDAGLDSDAPLATDQRGTGFPRIVGAHVDIGAFEVQSVANTTPQVACPNPAPFNCAPLAGLSLVVQANVTDPDNGQTLTVRLKEGATVLDSKTVNTPANNALVDFASVLFAPGGHRLTVEVDDGMASSSCEFRITISADGDAPVPNQQSLPPVTGQCSADRPPAPTANDVCEGTIIATTDAPATFGQGDFTIMWTYADSNGNSVQQFQEVHVHDTEGPVISDVPGTITVPATSAAGAVVTFASPTANDVCEGSKIVTCTPPSGSTFPVGPSTVYCVATDSHGNPTTTSFSVMVTPQAACDTPVVTITGPATGSVFAMGTAVQLSGSFTGGNGPFTAQWKVDGNVIPGVVNQSTKTVTATVNFAAAGVYSVQLTVANACGNSATVDTIDGLAALVVIYDPSAGFVTGGGWINSPAGAYPANPALTGKASFAFVSKYKKGLTVPTGETEFQFNAAGLKFNSAAYEWLVVNGARAQYKGTGSLNGIPGYGFILTAIDGQVTGGGGTDKFRVKIWQIANSTIIYDNQMGADDSATPTTTLGGGSIVIHK